MCKTRIRRILRCSQCLSLKLVLLSAEQDSYTRARRLQTAIVYRLSQASSITNARALKPHNRGLQSDTLISYLQGKFIHHSEQFSYRRDSHNPSGCLHGYCPLPDRPTRPTRPLPTARAVQQMYLCGNDEATGKNYDHRRDWITALTGIFAVSVCSS